MLYKTQGQIEREYDGKFFRENSLEKVLETLKNANVKDNVSFVNFVNDNIVSKTISPHNAIKPIKKEKAQQINRPLQKKY